jgi:hypothetical protein
MNTLRSILLLTLILSACASCDFGYNSKSTPQPLDATKVHWIRLPDPPEKAEHLLYFGRYHDTPRCVVVQSAQGNQYIRCKDAEWKLIDDVFSQTFGACPEGAYPQVLLELPGEVKECGYNYSWEWVTEFEYMVLLQDGALWDWLLTNAAD